MLYSLKHLAWSSALWLLVFGCSDPQVIEETVIPDAGPSFETNCTDGVDDDGDGYTDCEDSNCAAHPSCQESNCSDGVDNDGDGNTDCEDYDCRDIAPCEFPLETVCNDGVDNDGNGVSDCDDTSCSFSFHCTTTCPQGTTRIALGATGLPLVLNNASVTMSNDVTGKLVRIYAMVNIQHPDVDNIVLSVVAPDGTEVLLFNRATAFGADFLNTQFTDLAPTSVLDGQPPFNGTYRPHQLTGFFDMLGNEVTGDWTVNAADTVGILDGTLEDFQLALCVCDDCELGGQCQDGTDNDGDGNTDCADAKCLGVAPCEVAERTCDDEIDNDADGMLDCDDPDCADIAPCSE